MKSVFPIHVNNCIGNDNSEIPHCRENSVDIQVRSLGDKLKSDSCPSFPFPQWENLPQVI